MLTAWICQKNIKNIDIFVNLYFLRSFCLNYHFKILFLVISLLDDSFTCLLDGWMINQSICPGERMLIVENRTNKSSCSCIYILTEIHQWFSDQKSIWMRKMIYHILFHNWNTMFWLNSEITSPKPLKFISDPSIR
jgi:hypothetical protein